MSSPEAPGLPDNSPPEAERRLTRRKTLWANKLMRASLEFNNQVQDEVYLYLVDVSDGGMRVNLDRQLDESMDTRLRFKLGTRNFSALVRAVWQKCLPGGTWVVGLAFRDTESANVEAARQLTDFFSPQGRRQRFKLSETLPVTVQCAQQEEWHNMVCVDLSLTGLKMRGEQVFDDNEIVRARITLRKGSEAELRAQVMWQKKLGEERVEVGLRFLDPSTQAVSALQAYMDACVGVISNALTGLI